MKQITRFGLICLLVLCFYSPVLAQQNDSGFGLFRLGMSYAGQTTRENTETINSPMLNLALGGADGFGSPFGLVRVDLRNSRGSFALETGQRTKVAVGVGALVGWTKLAERKFVWDDSGDTTNRHYHLALYGSFTLNSQNLYVNSRVGPAWTVSSRRFGFETDTYFWDVSSGVQFRF